MTDCSERIAHSKTRFEAHQLFRENAGSAVLLWRLLLAEMEAAGAEPEENEEAEPAQFALAELEESAAFSKLQELEQAVRGVECMRGCLRTFQCVEGMFWYCVLSIE